MPKCKHKGVENCFVIALKMFGPVPYMLWIGSDLFIVLNWQGNEMKTHLLCRAYERLTHKSAPTESNVILLARIHPSIRPSSAPLCPSLRAAQIHLSKLAAFHFSFICLFIHLFISTSLENMRQLGLQHFRDGAKDLLKT